MSEQVLSEARRTQVIISSITEKLKQNQSASIQEQCRKAENFASILFDIASDRLQDVANEIRLSVQNVVNDAWIFTIPAPAGDRRSYYHRYQVVETAKQLGYFANLRNYHTWIQLVINVEASTTILVSFHVLGREYRGLLVCTACAYHRDNSEEAAVRDYQLAVGKLQSAKNNRAYQEYQASLEAARRVEEVNQARSSYERQLA